MINTTATLGKRIDFCAKRIGSKRLLAEQAIVSEAQLFRYIRNDSEPPASKLIAIAEAAGVNLEWLSTGAGGVEKSQPLHTQTQAAQRSSNLSHLIESSEKIISTYYPSISTATKAKAIALIDRSLTHETQHKTTTAPPTPERLLTMLDFLLSQPDDRFIDLLSEAMTFFETHNTAKPFPVACQSFVNAICQAQINSFNTASAKQYLNRIGQTLTPDLEAIIQPLLAEVMQRLGTQNIRMLDAGCGNGRFLAYIHRQYPHMSITGIEQAQLPLEAAHTLERTGKIPAGTVVRGDLRALPLANASVDFILMRKVLYCFPNLPGSNAGADEVIREAWRVLKPNGLLYIATRSGVGREYIPFDQLYTETELAQLGTRNGFISLWNKQENYNRNNAPGSNIPAQYQSAIATLMVKKA